MQKADEKDHLNEKLGLEQVHVQLHGLEETLVDLMKTQRDQINAHRENHHEEFEMKVELNEAGTREYGQIEEPDVKLEEIEGE